MFAKSIERAGGRRRMVGFTMVELVIVMILAAIMAAFAFPKVGGILALRNDAWRDQVLAALRHAHKTAISHRRVVCVDLAVDKIFLRIASAYGANECDTDLTGPDGSTTFASSGVSNVMANAGGMVYFHPDGRSTTVTGATVAPRTITVTGAPPLTLSGETGYVE